MKKIFQTLGLLIIIGSFSTFFSHTEHHSDALLDAVNNPERNIKYSTRDNFRNPYETLSF